MDEHRPSQETGGNPCEREWQSIRYFLQDTHHVTDDSDNVFKHSFEIRQERILENRDKVLRHSFLIRHSTTI